ncbi:MAG: Ig-like domain-containing protein [Chitinispirillales bacterium]|jgi:hypothetical protein|nr:Ig-like domain-containing protein [Chitinispirillales bacterium]
MKTYLIISGTVLAALLISCAHQSAPGGGPADTEPAQISASYPADGETNADRRSSIDITFSKWINLSSAKGSITIYPPIAEGFSVKAAKNKVKIIPNSEFKDNTTYHVIIGTALQDLRGNAVVKPIRLVFSTGAVLDSAKLSGSVTSLDPFVTLPKVALYEELENWSDTNYFSIPDYMTQCDSGGAFEFLNLREGKYRAVAFYDQNRAGRLRVGDKCYTSAEKTIGVSGKENFIRLYPSESDTLPPKINSIKAVDMNTLRGSWNKKYDLDRYPPPQWKIAETSADAKPVRINQTTAFANGVDFFITLHEPLKSGAYQFFYSYSDVSDSLRFNGSTVSDTARPVLKSHSPSGSLNLTPELRLIWSKPVRVSQNTITAVDTAGVDTAVFFCTDRYSDTTLLAVTKRLKPNRSYKISLPLQAVKDISGNTAAGAPVRSNSVKDSVDNDSTALDSAITILLNTISDDSLCYRIHGGAACLKAEEKRKWVYLPRGRDETYITAGKGGTFSFDSIPASKGKLYWFIDDNNDNTLTAGRLIPWRAPERFVVVPDSIEARARWEIDNLQVKACEDNE